MTDLIAEATTEVTEKFTVKQRLRATVEELISIAELPKAVVTLGKGFFDNFINNTSDEKITEMLEMMRSELIPFILGDDVKGDANDQSTDKS